MIGCDQLPMTARELVRNTRDAIRDEWSKRSGEQARDSLDDLCTTVADDMDRRYLVACTGAPAVVPVSGEVLLGITDLKFYQNDKLGHPKQGMHLHADGRLEYVSEQDPDPSSWSWQDGGWVVADGTLYYLTQHVGHLLPDGEYREEGLGNSAVLTGDVLHVKGKHVTIDDRGVVMVDGREGIPLTRVDGASDTLTKRTALLIIERYLGADGHIHDCPRDCRDFG